MPRAAKSASALSGHKTKEEIKNREAAEQALKTGEPLAEREIVRNDCVAHEEFIRVKKLMEILHKDDALYSAVINRYCQLYAECLEFQAQKESVSKASIKAQETFEELADNLEGEAGLDRVERFAKTMATLSRQIISIDAQIMTKRKMMFDIEKENVMTVASGLRSMPKEPPKKEDNPLFKILDDDN